MKLFRKYNLLVLLAALCCGCGGSSGDGNTPASGSEAPASETKKKGLIGYSAMSLTNPFFKIIADSITSE